MKSANIIRMCFTTHMPCDLQTQLQGKPMVPKCLIQNKSHLYF
uniref:Uncharacterized protein n=1 Tax=Anguilla anguilla TaxID=7936 RepID=A0A0E9RUD5_ANGAN